MQIIILSMGIASADMKVLVTGGSGRIGFKLIKKFLSNNDLVSSISKTNAVTLPKVKSFVFDLADKSETAKTIKEFAPDVIIHTAALTNVDLCETNHELAYEQNVKVTQNVIDACKEYGSKLVFVSSAFVFDDKGKIFTDGYKTNPINYYGETKALSEVAIKESLNDYLILRTDQPYGKSESWQKDDNVKRILKKLNNNQESKEPTDWYNNPTYLDDFVQATIKLIKDDKVGIYNLVGPDFISRYEWALKIAEVFGKNKNLIVPTDSGTFNLPAKRPTSRLSNEKVTKETGTSFLGVEKGLKKLKSEMRY